ncbi:EthD domain-containing protein [Aminobacter aminovorans]|uniref:Uncharacterized protein (TIGR02118 family) n=1 Tax=Aminobacter aminovorans TaxID=83263 RepID=A0AAC8YWE4_AMIAI|nr:EthD domain-containing protein [Aminobacter aminovorans]AMS45503.1 hypothetical protein AA2016_6613 [Aminobacter aminovorans]MBB3708578.1 uncharacterized protein (TIGR02118 family) [Aminobacter aminovorans]
MTANLKKIAFVSKREDLSQFEFERYWRSHHGPLLSSIPDYRDWRQRYLQNHIVGNGPLGNAFTYAGLAEFWLPGISSGESGFVATSFYKERIQPDEGNFTDADKTVAMTASEQIVIPGGGPVKIFVISKRISSITDDDFAKRLVTEYVYPIQNDSVLTSELRGWSIDLVMANSSYRPGAVKVDNDMADCVESFWFSNKDDAWSFLTSTAFGNVRENFLQTATSIFVDEYEMFDDCAPGEGGLEIER